MERVVNFMLLEPVATGDTGSPAGAGSNNASNFARVAPQWNL